MRSAKLFVNGRSQAVRLPKEFRFEGDEVYIKKTAKGVLLLPKNKSVWDVWEEKLLRYDEPLIKERNQPLDQQKREKLNEVFD